MYFQTSNLRVGAVVLLHATISALPTYAADPAMPPAATGILLQMDKEIAAAKSKAVVALEKVLKDTTKRGDLAGAMAVKQAVDQLKEGSVAMPSSSGRAGAATVVGRYRWRDYTYDFRPDGTVSHTGGAKGKWTSDGKMLEVVWENGFKYRLAPAPDGWAGIQVDPSGKEGDFTLNRSK